MKRTFSPYVYAILLLAIVSLQCNPKQKNIQEDHHTGLILATQAQYRRIAPAELPYGAGENLPPLLDLSPDMPEVGNQGRQQSCVAWATTYALKSFEEKKESSTNLLFSPSFVYNQINHGADRGSLLEDALKVLSQQGACTWDDMPYNEADYTTQPSEFLKQKAKPYGIFQWRRVNTADSKEVKMHLNGNYPVMIGTPVDEGFRAGRMDGTSEFIWNKLSGKNIGGHAMIVVGYDDSKNAFKVMNSWGLNWGNNGYCWIDYQFFENNIAEGYIAFDKPTILGPNTITETKPGNNVVIKNNPVYDPTQFKNAGFTNLKVMHNQNHPTYGNGMKITGVVDIPKGTGKTFQFSVHFYLSSTKTQVKSPASSQFVDVKGFAATGTILYKIPEGGLNNWAFEVFMPYTAFDIKSGATLNGRYLRARTNMYAIPTLFIDNFGYAKGEAINFNIDK